MIAGFFLLVFVLSSTNMRAWASDPAIVEPPPGSTLTSEIVLFRWDFGTQEDLYRIHVGTTGPGSKDIMKRNALPVREYAVPGIPLNGNPVYVRLWWRIAGHWKRADYVYQTTGGGGPSGPAPAPVPRTGQEATFYQDDDGELMMGVSWPNPRFTKNGDGTVTDNLTGQIWTEDADLVPGLASWTGAMDTCAALADGISGLTDGSAAGDWYLPNIRVLHSLVNYGISTPAVSNTSGTGKWTAGDPFNNVQSAFYWSSTTSASDTTVAWGVNLNSGSVGNGNKPIGGRVWCVRGGP
ncbi:MAG: hypothetical protein SCALA701_26460 [Candidatus Scalindua sp.]|nr:MAG: hypothetical protein SCALA701_26460 [Candidatus Scalindua sp.]